MLDKIRKTYSVDDLEIFTNTGWKDLTHVHLTKPFRTHTVKTRRGFLLSGADDHIVFNHLNKEVYLKDLKKGDLIEVNDTDIYDEVIEISVGDYEEMYDVSVDGEKYYTNGILSHNTTTTIGYLLHAVIFNEFQNIGILAHKLAGATEILYKLKTTYENLPMWLQPGVVKWNDGDIELGNGSRIKASATSKDAIRGETLTHVFLDEFAFVPDGIAEEFFTASLPTITAGKKQKMYIVSTPNGMNLFYKLWMQATNTNPKERSFFTPFEVLWNEIPARGQEFKESMLKSISESSWKQEYECVSGDTLIEVEIAGQRVKLPIEMVYNMRNRR